MRVGVNVNVHHACMQAHTHAHAHAHAHTHTHTHTLHLFYGQSSTNHHDDEPNDHDRPGSEAVSGVPVRLSPPRETQVGGRGKNECHGGRHQTTLGEGVKT